MMVIEKQELWDRAPERTRETARSVMIGASVAWWLIYQPLEHAYNGVHGYLVTAAGPINEHTVIVATNLPGQF